MAYGERLTKAEVMKELGSPVTIKKIGNNTFQVVYESGDIAVRYHHTNVVVTHTDGTITLNSGGWLTPTTKERINLGLRGTGYYLSQSSKVWYLTGPSGKSHTFQDGLTIHPDGNVTGDGADPKALLKLDKQITKYVAGYMAALVARKLDPPNGGDCWGCLFVDKDGKPVMDTDHYLNHFEEKYYVPSLCYNAVKRFPVSKAAEHMLGYWFKQDGFEYSKWFEDVAVDQVRKSLRRFLREQLGLAA